MALRGSTWTVCVLGLALGTQWGLAQTLPQTSEDALHGMVRQAGVIFTGQVVAVRRPPVTGEAASGLSGVVEIEFAVEDRVRGVSGGSYTLREWAGLWAASDQPFRVGQQYLMLLHSPRAGGLSSPVGGTDGAIPIRGGGPAVGPNGPGAGASAQAYGQVVDLRWVATRVVQPTGYAPGGLRPIGIHAESMSGASSVGLDSGGASGEVGIVSGLEMPVAASQAMAYETVLGILRSWEKNDHGAS